MRRRLAAPDPVSRATRLLLIVLVIGLAGCSDPVDPDDPAIGTYELITVNGQELPVLFTASQDLIEGTLIVRSNGTCGDRFVFRQAGVPEDAEVENQETGEACSWTRTRNTLRFAWESGTVTTGLVEGRRIETEIQGSVLVFER
jgi:hypothetical protein